MGFLKPRQVIWGLMIALTALVLAYLLWPRAILVDVALVSAGPMRVEVSEEGKTRVRELFEISVPLGGRLNRVDLHPGDAVVAGETVIARIEPAAPAFLDRRTIAELESALAAAKSARDAAAAEARRARADLDLAIAEYARQKELYAKGTIAEAALDRARARELSARAARDAARETLSARESDLARAGAALMTPDDAGGADGADGADDCCVTLRSPTDGTVLQVLRESEQVLAAGAVIATIGDPRDLEIVAEMLSSDVVTIAEGAPARITGWGGAPLEARVRRIEPFAYTKVSALGIEEQRAKVLLDIVSPSEAWAALGHGFRVDVHIVRWQKDPVLRVPVAALFRGGEAWQVFVLRGGRALASEIAVGEINDQYAEVLSGLEAGETVIVFPGEAVRDGVAVRSRAPIVP